MPILGTDNLTIYSYTKQPNIGFHYLYTVHCKVIVHIKMSQWSVSSMHAGRKFQCNLTKSQVRNTILYLKWLK